MDKITEYIKKQQHKEQQKHVEKDIKLRKREEKKEMKVSEKYYCECESVCLMRHRSRHLKSYTHIAYLNAIKVVM